MKRLSILLVLLLAFGAVMVQAQDPTATPDPNTNTNDNGNTNTNTNDNTSTDTNENANTNANDNTEVEPAPVWVRVVNWSPDTPAVDVWIDGALAFGNVQSSTNSDYQTFAAGTHTVQLTAAGTAPEAVDPAVSTQIAFDWSEGQYVTVAVVGSTGSGTLAPIVVTDDFSPIPFGSARLWVYHTVEGLGNLDVFVNGEMVITELGFPGTFTDLNGALNDGAFSVDVPVGTADIVIALTGDTAVTGLDNANDNTTDTNTNDNTDTNTNDNTSDNANDNTSGAVPGGLVTLPQFTLESGQIYTIAVVGSIDAPATFVTSQAGIALPQRSALDLAQGSGDFSVLAAAVAAADPAIGEMLAASGDFTVFAPTNAAFDAFLNNMAMTTDDLFANPDVLNAVLRYHVVQGRFDAAGIGGMNGQTLTSAQGEPISVTVNADGSITLNGAANVVTADNATSTGVVHVIDAVLVPPSLQQ